MPMLNASMAAWGSWVVLVVKGTAMPAAEAGGATARCAFGEEVVPAAAQVGGAASAERKAAP